MLIENVSRRSFLTAAGGLAIGFLLPLARGDGAAEAPAGAAPVPEINAWVVIRPDDTVVIRIARSEMGQGTLTGLAQLVAEELECDWSKVTTEYPTPGQNLARNRIWGDYLTAGSRGIRTSHEYVRKAGAAARQMLVEAAAKEWSVPPSEISAAKSVLRHKASDRSARYGEFDRWWQANTALNANRSLVRTRPKYEFLELQSCPAPAKLSLGLVSAAC